MAVAAAWLAFLPRNKETKGSNVVADIVYPDSGFPWYSLDTPGKRRDSVSN
jgi:hypothetical protein